MLRWLVALIGDGALGGRHANTEARAAASFFGDLPAGFLFAGHAPRVNYIPKQRPETARRDGQRKWWKRVGVESRTESTEPVAQRRCISHAPASWSDGNKIPIGLPPIETRLGAFLSPSKLSDCRQPRRSTRLPIPLREVIPPSSQVRRQACLRTPRCRVRSFPR